MLSEVKTSTSFDLVVYDQEVDCYVNLQQAMDREERKRKEGLRLAEFNRVRVECQQKIDAMMIYVNDPQLMVLLSKLWKRYNPKSNSEPLIQINEPLFILRELYSGISTDPIPGEVGIRTEIGSFNFQFTYNPTSEPEIRIFYRHNRDGDRLESQENLTLERLKVLLLDLLSSKQSDFWGIMEHLHLNWNFS